MFNLHKDLVINSFNQYPVTAIDASGSAIADVSATPATSGAKLKTFTGLRGVSSQERVDTLTVATDINFTAPSIATVVNVRIDVKAYNFAAEQARNELNLGEEIVYPITVLPTDTATTFTAKLLAAAQYRNSRFPGNDSVRIELGGGTAAAPTSITFTGENEFIAWSYDVTDEYSSNSTIVTSFTPANTTPRYRSTSDAKYVEDNIRVLTYESTRPYGIKQDQLAIDGSLYDVYNFSQVVADMSTTSSSVVAGEFSSRSEFTIYVNSNLRGSQELTNLVYFLDQAVQANGGTPEYVANTISTSSNGVEGEQNGSTTLAAIVA